MKREKETKNNKNKRLSMQRAAECFTGRLCASLYVHLVQPRKSKKEKKEKRQRNKRKGTKKISALIYIWDKMCAFLTSSQVRPGKTLVGGWRGTVAAGIPRSHGVVIVLFLRLGRHLLVELSDDTEAERH